MKKIKQPMSSEIRNALYDAFAELKSNPESKEALNKIRRYVYMVTGLEFNVSVVNNKTNKFFGMSIYPQENVVDKLIEEILSNKSSIKHIQEIWSEQNKWNLEIDSLLLNDISLNATPNHMIAILFHEIGHIIYSNEIPSRITRVIRYETMKLDFTVKKLLKWRKVHCLFALPIIEACSFKNFTYCQSKKALKLETEADKYVYEMGEGEHLVDFIDKLLKTQGNDLINRTFEDRDNDVRNLVNWTLHNISELEYRKTKLKQMLQVEVIKNPSPYVRSVVHKIKRTFFGIDSEDSYKEIMNEQYLLLEYKNIIKKPETSLFDKLGKIKKINQYEIDIIRVELNKMENEDDRLYVLDLIYDKLDIINAGLDLIDANKKDKVQMSKDTLIKYKNQLEKLRMDTLTVQFPDKQYGIFIKYPKDYMG